MNLEDWGWLILFGTVLLIGWCGMITLLVQIVRLF